jgi:hypothetical protein
MNLLSCPKDLLHQIAIFIAENPKDLAQFGAVCKKTQQIIKHTSFANLINFAKEYYFSEKRFVEITDNTNGLMLQQINRQANALLSIESLKSKNIEPLKLNQFLEEATKAREDFIQLQKEKDSLAKLDFHHPDSDYSFTITGGKLFELKNQIWLEIQKIKEHI